MNAGLLTKHTISGMLLLAAVLLLPACKSRKMAAKPAERPVPAAERTSNDLVVRLKKSSVDFRYFSAKLKANYQQEDGKDASFTLHLKMEKDRFIWVMATGPLGIEGARIYITPDSVKVLDRLAKKFLARDYSYFNRFTDVPLQFSSLQNLFVGNMLFNLPDTTPTDTLNGRTVLKQLLHATLYAVYPDAEGSHIDLQQLVEDAKKQELRIHYSNFRQHEGVTLPGKFDMEAMAKEHVKLTFEYQNYSFEPIEEIIFNIPASYKPAEE